MQLSSQLLRNQHAEFQELANIYKMSVKPDQLASLDPAVVDLYCF